jgi:glycosyltransferase involved in cell wall biosynthesis
MEAMATGLPIVTSPNSGTVARDGEEAFIAPYDAIDQHVALLERLIADRDLRVEMGRSAARSYRQFDMEAYSKRLTEVIHTTVQNRAGPARLGPGQPV